MSLMRKTTTMYPEGTEPSNQVDVLHAPRELQKFWGVPSNGILQSGYYTNSTPPIYSQQANYFFLQSIDAIWREEERNSWWEKTIPIVTSNLKKELYTTIEMNKFMAEKSAPGSPTLFTTMTLSSYMNHQEWFGCGFQVPWLFFETPDGVKEYNWKAATLSKSLLLSSRVNSWHEITGLQEPYIEWATRDANEDNVEKTFEMLMKRKKFLWNIIGDNFALEKIEELMNDEESMAGQIRSDVMICHPRVDTLRRNEKNYRNDSIGQYIGTSKEGSQNKPQAENRISRVGDSKVVFQEKIGIGGNVVYQPLESYSTIGEHYVFPNAYHFYPYQQSEKLRVIGIHDAHSDRTKWIPLSEGLKHAFNHAKIMPKGGSPWDKYTWKTGLTDKSVELLGCLKNGFKKGDNVDFAVKTLHAYFRKKANMTEMEENEIQYQVFAKDVPFEYTSLKFVDGMFSGTGILPETPTLNWLIARMLNSNSKNTSRYFNFLKYVDIIIKCFKELSNNTILDFDDKFTTKENDMFVLIYLALHPNNDLSTGNIPIDPLQDKTGVFKASGPKYKSLIHELYTYLDKYEFYGDGFNSKPLFYRVSKLLWYILKADVDTVQNLAHNGIECGVNVMACRLNMIYNTANIYRVRDNGETFTRLKGLSRAKISDDVDAEMHTIEMRELQGLRKTDIKGFSIGRNVAVLGHICGEGVEPIINVKILSDQGDINVDKYAKNGDILYYFIPMDATCENDIMHANQTGFGKKYNINDITEGIYNFATETDFDVTAQIESIQNKAVKGLDNPKKRANRITFPGPHFIYKLNGAETMITGNGGWTYCGDGSNRLRFDENIKTKQ